MSVDLLAQVPNWGGLLKRVEVAGSAQPNWGSFDTLFVVDGSRSWYSGEEQRARIHNRPLMQFLSACCCEHYWIPGLQEIAF